MGNRVLTSTVAGALTLALGVAALQALPAAADVARPRKRPATVGANITEPHAVAKVVDRGQGKKDLPRWAPPSVAAVPEGTSVIDLKSPGKATRSSVDVTKAAKSSGKATKAIVTTKRAKGFAGVVAVVSVATDQPDQVTLDADPRMVGVSADRVQFYRLSGCDAASSGDVAGCITTPIATTVSADSSSVTAKVAATQTATAFAVATTSGGEEGNFAATPFNPSSTWNVGGSTGDFGWAYDLDVPPSLSGLEPQLSLNYSSGVVDGRTSSANNQASWVGEGFSLAEGQISRIYVPCSKDMTGSNTTTKTGDLCWGPDDALYSFFGGHSGELVQVGTSGTYRLRNDDGTRFQRKTSASNGVAGGEYWVMTTGDGTQYVFGDTAASAWTVPVAGNQSGEPGHAAAFGSSFTTQAWAWKLSTVTDVNGNQVKYTWVTETNNYGKNNNTSGVATYTRGGYLSQIDYGLTPSGSVPTARVSFTMGDRCSTSSCALTVANQGSWPDVPVDQICTSTSTCPTQTSPTFFTTKKLTKATTSTYTAASTYTPVESWSFTYQFPDPGDGTRPSLWLSKIDHTVTGDTKVLSTSFAGKLMPSRVDGVESGTGQVADPFNKYRVVGINTESASQINVFYSEPECTSTMVATLDRATNTKRCFPAQYSPYGSDTSYRHWFHKYVVDSVTVNDLTGASTKPQTVSYSYGLPAWRWNDSPGTLTSDRDWGVFAGFTTVTAVTGQSTDGTALKTTAIYYRGLNGDKAASGTKTVTVTGNGVADTDDWWKAGTARETITYNGAAVVSREVNTPSGFLTVATNSANRVAGHGGAAKTTRITTLAAGGARTTETATAFDAYGNTTQITDLFDTATSSDDQCTKISYSINTTAWITNSSSQKSIRTGTCAAWPAAPTEAQFISDLKYTYDTKGQLTKSEQATSLTAGVPGFQTMSQASYDTMGRQITATDAKGKVATTSFGANSFGRPTSITTTSPDPDDAGPLTAHVTTTTLDPTTGLPTKVVKPGGETTEATYDAWGRVTQVWDPLRPRASNANPTVKYTYQWPGTNTLAAIKTERRVNAGNYVASVQLYDGFGRLRQTQSQTIDSKVDSNGAVIPTTGRLIADTVFDSRGLTVLTSRPLMKTGSPDMTLVGVTESEIDSYTKTSYDGAGRATEEKLYSRGVLQWTTSQTIYGGDRTTTIPAQGKMPSTAVTDARGNTVELRAYKTTATTGAYDSYRYSYNNKNQLVAMTDAGNNTWSYGYDLLGRTVSVKDPNAAAPTISSYDVLGQLASTTDPNGNLLTLSYDNLGRKTAQYDGTIATGTQTSTWSYDTIKKGYPSTSTRIINGAAVSDATTAYDAAGNPTGSTTTIPAISGVIDAGLVGSYTTSNVYNTDGTLARIVTNARGPLAAEAVRYGYDTLGRVSNVLGVVSLMGSVVYDGLGQVTQTEQLATTNQAAWNTNTYTPATGRLATSRVDRQTKPGADALIDYTYDQSGQLTALSTKSFPDTTAPAANTADTQCFTQDYLGRLTQAWTTNSDTCSTPTFAEPAPYRMSWTL